MQDYDARPTPDEYDAYYASYIAIVPEGGVIARLERQVVETRRMLEAIPDALANHAYAPGKWTIKEVIGHIADSERIFAYRALRFARGDTTALAGYKPDPDALPAAVGARPLADILDELTAVRRATVALLRGLPSDAWTRRGIASGKEISVRALAWVIAGHELHHQKVLVERYGVKQPSGGS
ncbi:MAG TPA: DinB family protein [Longimicrobiales bacterium]